MNQFVVHLKLIQYCKSSMLLFSCSVMSNSLPSHGLQHARLPCPISRSLLRFMPTAVGDVVQSAHPLLPPSPPALNLSQHQSVIPMSQLFSSGGQSIGTSASVVPMNIQG